MRRALSVTFGMLAALMSLLIALPTITYNNSLWVIQMLLGEFSWIPLFAGALAAGFGLASRSKSPWGVLLGLFAIVWSIIPFWQARTAAKLNDAAMREGLGDDYLRAIPPVMRAHCSGTLVARDQLRQPDTQLQRRVQHRAGCGLRLYAAAHADVRHLSP